MRNAGIIFALIIVCIGLFGCDESRWQVEFQKAGVKKDLVLEG